jgi:hypothetical protein
MSFCNNMSELCKQNKPTCGADGKLGIYDTDWYSIIDGINGDIGKTKTVIQVLKGKKIFDQVAKIEKFIKLVKEAQDMGKDLTNASVMAGIYAAAEINPITAVIGIIDTVQKIIKWGKFISCEDDINKRDREWLKNCQQSYAQCLLPSQKYNQGNCGKGYYHEPINDICIRKAPNYDLSWADACDKDCKPINSNNEGYGYKSVCDPAICHFNKKYPANIVVDPLGHKGSSFLTMPSFSDTLTIPKNHYFCQFDKKFQLSNLIKCTDPGGCKHDVGASPCPAPTYVMDGHNNLPSFSDKIYGCSNNSNSMSFKLSENGEKEMICVNLNYMSHINLSNSPTYPKLFFTAIDPYGSIFYKMKTEKEKNMQIKEINAEKDPLKMRNYEIQNNTWDVSFEPQAYHRQDCLTCENAMKGAVDSKSKGWCVDPSTGQGRCAREYKKDDDDNNKEICDKDYIYLEKQVAPNYQINQQELRCPSECNFDNVLHQTLGSSTLSYNCDIPSNYITQKYSQIIKASTTCGGNDNVIALLVENRLDVPINCDINITDILQSRDPEYWKAAKDGVYSFCSESWAGNKQTVNSYDARLYWNTTRKLRAGYDSLGKQYWTYQPKFTITTPNGSFVGRCIMEYTDGSYYIQKLTGDPGISIKDTRFKISVESSTTIAGIISLVRVIVYPLWYDLPETYDYANPPAIPEFQNTSTSICDKSCMDNYVANHLGCPIDRCTIINQSEFISSPYDAFISQYQNSDTFKNTFVLQIENRTEHAFYISTSYLSMFGINDRTGVATVQSFSTVFGIPNTDKSDNGEFYSISTNPKVEVFDKDGKMINSPNDFICTIRVKNSDKSEIGASMQPLYKYTDVNGQKIWYPVGAGKFSDPDIIVICTVSDLPNKDFGYINRFVVTSRSQMQKRLTATKELINDFTCNNKEQVYTKIDPECKGNECKMQCESLCPINKEIIPGCLCMYPNEIKDNKCVPKCKYPKTRNKEFLCVCPNDNKWKGENKDGECIPICSTIEHLSENTCIKNFEKKEDTLLVTKRGLGYKRPKASTNCEEQCSKNDLTGIVKSDILSTYPKPSGVCRAFAVDDKWCYFYGSGPTEGDDDVINTIKGSGNTTYFRKKF